MRELTLIETGYSAGLLVLSLVLPLMVSLSGARSAAARGNCIRMVWVGQVVLAMGGVGVLVSSAVAVYALALAVMGWIACVVVLKRQLSIAA